MALFSKAKSAAKSDAKVVKSKGTAWSVGRSEEHARLSTAVKQMVAFAQERKTIEAKESLAKSVVSQFAFRRWVEQYANGNTPDTPMKVVDEESGQSVTYVVQNLLGSKEAKPEVVDGLRTLLGDGAMEEVVWDQTTFGFNPMVMCQKLADGTPIQAWIEGVLELAIQTAIEAGQLSETQAEGLISADTRTAFYPGLFDNIPRLAGKRLDRVQAVIDLLGSAIVKYPKA